MVHDSWIDPNDGSWKLESVTRGRWSDYIFLINGRVREGLFIHVEIWNLMSISVYFWEYIWAIHFRSSVTKWITYNPHLRGKDTGSGDVSETLVTWTTLLWIILVRNRSPTTRFYPFKIDNSSYSSDQNSCTLLNRFSSYISFPCHDFESNKVSGPSGSNNNL